MLARELGPKRIVGTSFTMKCPVCGFTRSLRSLRNELAIINPSVALDMWVRTVRKGVKGLAWEQLEPRHADQGAREILQRARAGITRVMLTWLERFAALSDGTPLSIEVHTPSQVSGKRTPTMLEAAPSHMSELPPARTELTAQTMLETSSHGP